jgi:hypothetical protein
MSIKRKISLVVSDVDGTILTEDKVLTDRARNAVLALHRAGIYFAITSGRPPLGMAMLIDPLELSTPLAGFNGGLFVKRDFTIIEQKTLPFEVARQSIDLLHQKEVDVWLYCGNDWLITKPDGAHVVRETWTVKFQPTIVPDYEDRLSQVTKIVGVSDDFDLVRKCELDAQARFGAHASATRSQNYYLDITNKAANKGAVVDYHAKSLGVPIDEIVTIGDGLNDVLMFKRSGFSIAMGNASDEVKAQANTVTDSYNDEGFAKAIETIVLGSINQ